MGQGKTMSNQRWVYEYSNRRAKEKRYGDASRTWEMKKEVYLPRFAGCFKKGTDSENVPGKTAMRGVLTAAANG